ncbi:hypothetical protein JHK85_001525 [Glycine max]|uniref:Uncharacterized protein n=2 Tax=Glycine subgen. Soja TaxID=1462606 RepID=K7K3E1_SOYBN|nr:hypothetical protein JHK87_001475 [Glycine soja]KAG5069148.1 hypothetical protein JHK85_001525 [Glycine max]KAG5088872.1 hypothetical protein JHK86_001484 [Glycine max]KAH1162762.1 hypothetical protein GYH30_001314 [Glycine max]KHN14980.1 hypothetical protein glysoja_049343 [Glycine soja]
MHPFIPIKIIFHPPFVFPLTFLNGGKKIQKKFEQGRIYLLLLLPPVNKSRVLVSSFSLFTVS